MAPVPEPPPDLTDGDDEGVPPESPAEGVVDDEEEAPAEPSEPG